jgi:hypothetical protein
VTGNVVDRLAGEVEAGHATLTGGGPIWAGAGPRYAVPLAWEAATVPLVPCELWSRHWVLPGAMVARNGFPGMCVGEAQVLIWVELRDWGLPPPAPPALLLGPWLELLPKALSSCVVT